MTAIDFLALMQEELEQAMAKSPVPDDVCMTHTTQADVDKASHPSAGQSASPRSASCLGLAISMFTLPRLAPPSASTQSPHERFLYKSRMCGKRWGTSSYLGVFDHPYFPLCICFLEPPPIVT